MAAKDVVVMTIRRAECRAPGCTWRGGEWPGYQEANAERLAHLNWHILGQPTGDVVDAVVHAAGCDSRDCEGACNG